MALTLSARLRADCPCLALRPLAFRRERRTRTLGRPGFGAALATVLLWTTFASATRPVGVVEASIAATGPVGLAPVTSVPSDATPAAAARPTTVPAKRLTDAIHLNDRGIPLMVDVLERAVGP